MEAAGELGCRRIVMTGYKKRTGPSDLDSVIAVLEHVVLVAEKYDNHDTIRKLIRIGYEGYITI